MWLNLFLIYLGNHRVRAVKNQQNIFIDTMKINIFLEFGFKYFAALLLRKLDTQMIDTFAQYLPRVSGGGSSKSQRVTFSLFSCSCVCLLCCRIVDKEALVSHLEGQKE